MGTLANGEDPDKMKTLAETESIFREKKINM